MLINDFSIKGEGFIRDYKNTIEILENAASGIRFKKSFIERKAEVKAYELLLKNNARMNSIAAKIEASLTELIRANKTLVQIMEKKKLSDISSIESLTTGIKELADTARMISQ